MKLGQINSPAKIANLEWSADERDLKNINKNAGETAQDALGRVATVTAARVGKRMADVISKEHRFGVGFTGKASRNIILDARPVGRAAVSVDIYEGDLTPANTFIRMGRRSNRPPNIQDIIEWIEKKAQLSGEIHYDPSKYGSNRSKKAQTTKPEIINFTKPRKNAPSRVYKRQRTKLEQAAFLIARKIASAGGGQRMVGLSPVGKPTFDYARYVLAGSGFNVFNSPEFNLAAQLALVSLTRSYFRFGVREQGMAIPSPKWVVSKVPVNDFNLREILGHDIGTFGSI